MDVLKPFLMLACVAFVVGFMGYLGAAKLSSPSGPPAVAQAEAQVPDPQSSAASTPASADDWNAGKRV